MPYEVTPSQATVIAIGAGNAATTAPGSDTFTTIVGVVDFSGPGGEATVIDTTHLGSTAKEKLIGLRDEGQLSLSMNYSSGDAGQAALRAAQASRTLKNIKITFADSGAETADFKAYVLGGALSGGVDSKVESNVTLEITGAITWTA